MPRHGTPRHKVYGFTSEKNLVEVYLTVDEIVANRIHPWWVDLFEPEPYVKKVNGQTLYFTRLHDITFAYVQAYNQVVICVLDRSTWNCIVGTVENNTSEREIKLLGTGSGSFEDHFRQYLQQRRSLGAFARYELVLRKGKLLYPQSDSWQISKNVKIEHQFNGYAFGGEMYTEVPLHVQMPTKMRWVFEAFGDWHPMVFGGSLRDLVRRGRSNDIDFIVDKRTSGEIRARLAQLPVEHVANLTDLDYRGNEAGWPIFEFYWGSKRFHLVCRGNFLADHIWLANDFSVNQLRAEQPDIVLASRVALWDIAHKQARIISRSRYSENSFLAGNWKIRAEKLATYGFKILRNEFATHQDEQVGWT